MRLRSQLLVLILATLLPVLAFSAVMMILFNRQTRVATEKGLVETARALSIAVDREVSASVSVLEALATSPRLETGDLKSFYADARSLLSVRGTWGNIILYDPEGQQLLNTVRPFGEPLPVAANYQLVRRVAHTRSAAISDLFTGAVLRKPILLVLVPVVQGNAARHVLGATIAPSALTNVLLQQKLPPESICSLLDRNQVIIARTRAAERFVGERGTPDLVARMNETAEGAFRLFTRDGQSVYAAISRSSLTGWTIAMGVPVGVVDGPLRSSLWLLIVVAGGCIVLGMVAAAVVARRIAQPMQALASSAGALASGPPPSLPTYPIAEVNEMARAMEAAGQKRQQVEAWNAQLLEESERRRQEAEELGRMPRLLNETLDVAEIGQRIVAAVLPLLRVEYSVLRLLDPDGSLRAVAASGSVREHFEPGHVLPPGVGVMGRVVVEGRPVSSRDVVNEPNIERTEDYSRRLAATGARAALAVPLRVKGQVVGVLGIAAEVGRSFAEPEVTLLQTFADQATLALENARLYAETMQQKQYLADQAVLLRSSLENISHGLSVFDRDLRLVVWNERFLDLLDFPRELGRSGQPAAAFFRHNAERGEYGPGDPEEQVMRLVAWAGQLEPHDFEWRRRDGAVIRVRSNPMPGGGLVTTYTDITARKVAEETLLKLSSAVEQTADLVMITGRNGVIEYVNPGFEAVTGYPGAEAVGQTPRLLKSGYHDRAFYRQLWDTVLSGRVFRDVLVNQKRSGESYFEDKTITPIKDSTGTITHFVATGRDITEQKLAERAMQALIEGTAAAVGEEFFRSLVRHLAQALGVRHALIAEISGPARDRIVTRAVWSVNDFAHDFEHALADGPCSGILRKQEYIYPQGAREAFPRDELLERMQVESFLGTSLRSSAGEVLGLLAVMDGEPMEQVVHARALLKIFGARAGAELERERAAAALHASELQLRQSQKMDAVGQLAGGIAHDFNNLLTVIGGRSALLLQRLSPTDPGRSDVELISKTANRAAQLTRQLLAFSRRQILELRVVDVNAVVTSMQSLLRRLIGEHIELTVRPDPSLARVKADPGQLEQIVMNLAVNARDAMPQGGHLTIETQNATLDAAYARSHPGAEAGPYVMLAVSDTGIGMNAETQSRVFEPFFTTKEVGKGTGLGLAMVYGIVKQSGGYIALSSELGHGTTFKLYLPRVDASEEVVGPAAGSGEMPRGSEIVLLVEDEGDVRDLAREILEGLGYTVLPAGSPEDALEIGRQRQEPIHLLLTDVIMPGMSGSVLADLLRAARPDLRVLYMSGYTDDAIDRHGVLDPGMAFLQKPFTPEALARKVGEVLRAPGQVGSSEL